jgi:hypothetical protein
MESIQEHSGNGQGKPTIPTIEQDRAKRARANLIRRINRRLADGNEKLVNVMDTNSRERRLLLVHTCRHHAIDLEKLGRELGAVIGVSAEDQKDGSTNTPINGETLFQALQRATSMIFSIWL